jgi:hypothetical protein
MRSQPNRNRGRCARIFIFQAIARLALQGLANCHDGNFSQVRNPEGWGKACTS